MRWYLLQDKIVEFDIWNGAPEMHYFLSPEKLHEDERWGHQ